jgi:hypothetical protein
MLPSGPSPGLEASAEAGIDDQLQAEQEAGIGHVTYSLGEFLDEFTDAPNSPAPTFDRLAQFKRDYTTLTALQRQPFRAARAIYTFGRAIRAAQPHVIWCRIGTGDALDKPPGL